jgi:hypothetical protein
VTTDQLKQLAPRDRVVWLHGGTEFRGQVHAADGDCVEIFWHDGTSSLIWFAHCGDGRDTRHQNLFRRTAAESKQVRRGKP